MPELIEAPPVTTVSEVTEVMHGVSITDPYRWLEDRNSPETCRWLTTQSRYSRSYLDSIPGRERIRGRVQELLDVETVDSVLVCRNRFIFRKRIPRQQQPSIWMREGRDGEDRLLLDIREHGADKYTAVRPLTVSPDGRLLLLEIKEGGGKRTSRFAVFDIARRETLPDGVPRGYLRGFCFSPDSQCFYYAYEPADETGARRRRAYRHVLGTDPSSDEEVFAVEHRDSFRLQLVPGQEQLGFLVYRIGKKIITDFYVSDFGASSSALSLVADAEYSFGPLLLSSRRILAITDLHAPNFRIVELRPEPGGGSELLDLVPASASRIQDWAVTRNHIFVGYVYANEAWIDVFDLSGNKVEKIEATKGNTLRLKPAASQQDTLILEQESFTKPIQICTCTSHSPATRLWRRREVPFDSQQYDQLETSCAARDGTRIPIFLVGRRELLSGGSHPTIMTSYGGFGIAMTPRFSLFVAYLMERGCLFALPNIRGGSEFGSRWHDEAKRRRKQVAFDDFLSAAEWLIRSGHTDPKKLAIFGGSNSGLLVAAALTQRPDLFRAVVCILPILDMLRYHLFDQAHLWIDEFGFCGDRDDFLALARYSPYHHVRDGTAYPATLIVSGDADQNCNPLHARKMIARLQAANSSTNPVILDYSPSRGHSPVLPLSERIESLTDRLAFVCDQLGIQV